MMPAGSLLITYDGKGHFEIDAPVQNEELCNFLLAYARKFIDEARAKPGRVVIPSVGKCQVNRLLELK